MLGDAMMIMICKLLSIEGVDWPKLHDMFKARDAKRWQREFPDGICALNFYSFTFHDAVAIIESRYVIQAKYVLLLC